MQCAWNALLEVMPKWFWPLGENMNPESVLEVRLRRDRPLQIITQEGIRELSRAVTQEDISQCVNAASKYSPWAAATVGRGFLTVEGGHRIGLCGEAVVRGGEITSIQNISSLCIRVAKDYRGISKKAGLLKGSVLILGAPGWGKTTLLRDLIRSIGQNQQVTAVDERKEIFPEGFDRGRNVDVLAGASKEKGIDMALRTMGPAYIAVDEITSPEDCKAVLMAHGCGVRLLATAHGSSVNDLHTRQVYRPLLEHNVFQSILILRADRSFRTERIQTWNCDGSVRY